MAEKTSAPAEKVSGPASYFPSIEKKYGKTIAEWREIVLGSGLDGHASNVNRLKSEFGLGHGHANALVGYFLNPGKWPEYRP